MHGALEKLKTSVGLDPNNVNAKEALSIAPANKSENDKKAEESYRLG